MSKCFIFAEGCTDKGSWSVCLDHAHRVVIPLAFRDFSELKDLQKNRQKVLILPAKQFNIYQVPLPKVSGKTARAAIPFALEEQLSQSITEFHFAFDQSLYEEGRYLVVVGEKRYLRELLASLSAHALQWDQMTLDWFALDEGEVVVGADCIFVKDVCFQGSLDEDLAPLYWQKVGFAPGTRTCYRFLNTPQKLFERFSEIATKHLTQKTEPDQSVEMKSVALASNDWIAQRLSERKFMNLSQGEFQTATASVQLKRWYQLAGGLGVAWLVTFVVHTTLMLSQLNKELMVTDAKIGHIYHEFFPQSVQVISPKFRITQLLKTHQNQEMNQYWHLLNALAKHWDVNEMELEQMRFQNQIMFVTLITQDFQTLETLCRSLRHEGIQVKQKQAAMSHQKVLGTVELH